ncbi:peptidase M14 [Emticicia sp. CRIBPO]|uniref:M14 family metallopeptidase n=1 Tax=Emticicia sp. CRIBPO TaxID=2683258 RepID=UPI001412D4D0|nr:M14 family metallopeptidase [Emticicia sp. CRIBPO]NBA85092.1 peptidase M14 [Emticicia sp. CRIBPO]
MKKYILLLMGLVSLTAIAQKDPVISPEDLNGIRAIGSPANPKVKVYWNKYSDQAEITRICQDLAKAYPELVKLESIGKSVEGRDLWVMSISDFKSGNADRKPGFYIDGNIHANELQGTEVALYTAWYLAESFQTVDFIKQLLKDKVFYVIPTINPDSREYFIKSANNPHSSRTGRRAFDEDGDGLTDEDKLDDLDGDGNIVMMRRKSATGRWKIDCDNPQRMIPAKQDEPGEYEMLGYEGIDNDGDGLVNEDATGTYDPNRDWAWNWQPDYVQRGALFYPGTLPETQAIKAFIKKHPNIAGAQSYHNNGGMFLRGPGAAEDDPFYDRADVDVYNFIGKLGERMVPGYKYFVIHKDLYTVYGGEIDWLALNRGVFTFSNELMTSYKLFNDKAAAERGSNQEFEEFDKYLLFGDGYVQWKPFKHPQYGDIEIGGPKKNYLRNHPGFLLMEDAHRNMAFTILHAQQMPKLEVIEVNNKDLGGGLTEVTATVINRRIMPTHSSHDVKYKIERPDYITIKNAEVIAGMIVENEDFNLTKEQKNRPEKLEIRNIPGMGAVKVRWVIKGKSDKAAIEVDSMKGGVVSKTI